MPRGLSRHGRFTGQARDGGATASVADSTADSESARTAAVRAGQRGGTHGKADAVDGE